MMNAISLNPQLDNLRIINHIGGKSVKNISYAAKQKIQTIISGFKEWVKPNIYYKKYPIDWIAPSSIGLCGDVELCSRKLAKTLSPCRDVVVFIATIGENLEKEVASLSRRNRTSMAYIMDAIGSVAVENTVERFQKLHAETYKKTSQYVSLRFSPGYCDWSIKEQEKIFSLFDNDQLHVKLSDTYLMHPRKSISGVFGVTPPLKSSFYRYNPCRDCRKHNCDGRREKYRLISSAN